MVFDRVLLHCYSYTTTCTQPPSTVRLTVPQLVRRSFLCAILGEEVKGLSCQYSRTKPPFGLISIRVTFLWGKAKGPAVILNYWTRQAAQST